MTRIAVPGVGATGLRWPNYVNGRLLTAQDLVADQDAVLERDRWLGRAVGPGVVEGLEVTGSPGASVLHVSPGTGVCPGGTAVHLDTPAALDLNVVTSAPPVDGARFADCRPSTTATQAPSAGAYVLAMAPASSYQGQVPVLGAPTATLPTPCTSRWEVEDLVFVVIRLDGFAMPTTPANRRNLLAHWCFGSAQLDDLALSGFVDPVPYGGIAALADLTACDLPLAVFDWSGSVLTFVDRWSARRRPVRPPATLDLAPVVGDQRAAEGEARFLQFQDQLTGLLATPAGRSIRAVDVFPRLPPAGLVPIDPIDTAQLLLKTASPDFSVAAAPSPEPGGRTPPPQSRLASRTAGGFDERRLAMAARIADAGPGGGAGHMVTTSLNELLEQGPFVLEGASSGRLGLLAQQLQQMQAQIDALREDVDDVTLAVEGRGGGDQSSAARAYGAKVAGALVMLLVDTAGDGVNPGLFFDGIQLRLGVVDLETVDFTIRRSWCDEAVDLGKGPILNVFFVVASDGDSVAPYLLFTKRLRGVRWIDKTARTLT